MRKHMIHWGRVLFTTIILAAMCSFYRAQDNNSSIRPANKDNYTFLDRPDSEVAGQEEKIIKKTYDKLTFLADANRKSLIGAQPEKADSSTKRIAFSVNIIKSGGIEEIIGRPLDNLLTLPSGERIDVTRSVRTTSDNDKEGKVSYSIKWTESPYIRMNDRGAWPLRDILTAMGPEYANVRKYTTYEVMAVLDGKSKNYLAVALYHTPLQSSEEPRVEIWDAIAGTAGVLTSVFNEQLPPLESVPSPSPVLTSECGCRRRTVGRQEAPNQYNENNRNHENGVHKASSTFKKVCERYEDCTHTCIPSVTYSDCSDSGIVQEIVFTYHVCGKSEAQKVPGPMPRSGKVECEIGIGYGFDSCLIPTCGVSVSAGISGHGASASITVSGGNLWSQGHVSPFACQAY